jgi:hypothetical protein
MKTFKCKKVIADYLMYKKGLPLLDVDKKYYYFLHDESLDKILESLPLWLKLLNIF